MPDPEAPTRRDAHTEDQAVEANHTRVKRYGKQQPLHVLYLNHYLTRPQSEQGTWGRRMVRELRARGVRVTTLPSYDGRTAVELGECGPVHQPVSTFLKRSAPRWLRSVLIEMAAVYRGVASSVQLCLRAWCLRATSPDVVYGRVFYCDWAPWLVGRVLRCPIILEVHSPHYLERVFRGWRRSNVLRFIEHVQWRRASYIRVVSKPVMGILEQEGVPPENIRFIPYGITIVPRRESTAPTEQQPITVTFVGSFYAWHGVGVLLHAFALVKAHLPHVQLTLVGDGHTRVDDERLAVSLGIASSVRFLGWLSHDRMIEHVRHADIAVAPFIDIQPFYFDPAKILDYMSAGVAIIASRLGRIAEMLQDGRGGELVPPGDSAALSAAIITLAENHSLRNQLGTAAQDILREEGYTWDTTAQRIITLCEDAVARPRDRLHA